MPSDAHAHPHKLRELFPQQEAERRRLGIACAASAWNLEEFEYHERLAREAARMGAPPVLCCFAVHPQLAAADKAGGRGLIRESLETLERLVREGRVIAVGETGFDCFNREFRETAPLQEELFAAHLEFAIQGNLPVVLHVRRAMDRVFAHTKELRKVPAAIFHSYSGTLEDGVSLLRQGVNGYFSFGNPIGLNHKTAIAACASLPKERLLLETDAPYQPWRGEPYSHWEDLAGICREAAAIRQESPEELQSQVDANFREAFGLG